MDLKNFIIILLIFSSFYSFGLTTLVYSMPSETKTSFLELETYNNEINQNINNNKIEESFNKIRTGIPLVDIAGSLVFFTGNILIDLILNFFTAVPSFISLFINILFSFFIFDTNLLFSINVFVFSLLSMIYFINLIFSIVNIFSRGG